MPCRHRIALRSACAGRQCGNAKADIPTDIPCRYTPKELAGMRGFTLAYDIAVAKVSCKRAVLLACASGRVCAIAEDAPINALGRASTW